MNDQTETSLSRRKKFTFSLVTVVGLAVGLLLFCEIVLRLMGERVLWTEPVNVVVEPGGSLFVTHPRLGYTHRPGVYRVTVRDSLVFTLTHRADGLRITRPLDVPPVPGAPQLWILGGSFTYGWTVDDPEAYPWRLQERLPAYDVVNLGVNGYGTVHALLQVEQALAQGRPPAAVVVAYASYHDERNTFLRLRRKAVFLWNRLGDLRQPYARLAADGEVEIHLAEVVYREFPLTRYSVLMHAVERLYNRIEERLYDNHAVSEALMLALAERCRAHGIPLIVAGLYDDALTAEMLDFCRQRGILAVDIAVDLSLPQHNQRPHDSHPNALAHEQYAAKLHAFLIERLMD